MDRETRPMYPGGSGQARGREHIVGSRATIGYAPAFTSIGSFRNASPLGLSSSFSRRTPPDRIPMSNCDGSKFCAAQHHHARRLGWRGIRGRLRPWHENRGSTYLHKRPHELLQDVGNYFLKHRSRSRARRGQVALKALELTRHSLCKARRDKLPQVLTRTNV